MAIHACTIIARNYLAFARVLYSSFIANNPGGTLSVLIIDDRYEPDPKVGESFEVVLIDEIGIEQSEILKMAAIYNVTEFATAVKPWLLHSLIERWNEPVIYLDPDIMVFQSLEEILSLALQHEIVITPHSSDPIPRDDKRISESEVLAAGIYNLGFIGVGVNGVRFLEFWKERLKRDCISDPKKMRFVDQRWVDFAPAMFDAYILKDPTYNVAYWNLHSHDVSIDRATDQYLVDGLPMHFFHFSGYDPHVPELLSKYQGGTARILFSDRPDLQRICDHYGELLLRHGYDEVTKYEYRFAKLDNGMRCDNYMRNVYREELIRAEKEHLADPPNPFESSDLFLQWLNSPAAKEIISRYLKKVYESRSDLREHFPNAEGSGFSSLVDWCWDEAAKGNFDYRLIPQNSLEQIQVAQDLIHIESRQESENGIQISGYFRAEMGVGELGRNTVKAVNASGIPYSTATVTDVIHRQNLDFQEKKGGAHRVNIICMNADSLVHFVYRMGSDYFKDRYTIAVWAWELEEFPPDFDESFEYVDEIWACSEFTRNAVATRGLKPVFALPVTVETAEVVEAFDRSDHGIPDAYMFLFCFDLLSIFERKNPLAVIDAFKMAFAPNEGPVLVIKALNGDKRLADLEKIRFRAKGRSDIIVLTKYLDHAQNVSLYEACNCYVSLHRSEGLGLTIAEAMSHGKPVIATEYSGNLDFMNNDNSYLVPFTYGEVPEGSEPYRVGARWADPDVTEAAKIMRHVYQHQEEATIIGNRARQDILDRHSAQVTSAFITDRYENAIRVLQSRAAGDNGSNARETDGETRDDESQLTGDTQSPPPPALIALASRPFEYSGHSRFTKLSRLARKVLRRMLLVRDNQQQEFNIALAMGTEHLARLWNEMHNQLDTMRIELERHSITMTQLNRGSNDLNNRLSQISNSFLEQNIKSGALVRNFGELSERIDVLGDLIKVEDSRIIEIEQNSLAHYTELKSQLQVVPYMADPGIFNIESDDEGRRLGYKGAGQESAYASFEDIFRGPEEFIRARQVGYLKYINASGKIIDIGCGRGEFLDVLKEAGLKGLGIDNDTSMSIRARGKDHEVIEADGVDFLKNQSSESISSVFSAQFIEHLGYEELREFIRQSFRSLSRGGVLIMETVNPYSLPAFRTFWTDLTHEKPIFPEVLLAYVREEGFSEAQVIFPNGTGNLDVDRWHEGEFAVIAHR